MHVRPGCSHTRMCAFRGCYNAVGAFVRIYVHVYMSLGTMHKCGTTLCALHSSRCAITIGRPRLYGTLAKLCAAAFVRHDFARARARVRIFAHYVLLHATNKQLVYTCVDVHATPQCNCDAFCMTCFDCGNRVRMMVLMCCCFFCRAS